MGDWNPVVGEERERDRVGRHELCLRNKKDRLLNFCK